MVIFTLFAVKLYDSNNIIAMNINNFLSNRIYYASTFYHKYGISLFGKEVEYISTYLVSQSSAIKALVLYNSYLVILLNYGILSLITFSLIINKS